MIHNKRNQILENKEIAKGYFKLIFISATMAKKARPGQFVHIRVSAGVDPLLRRPLSIHRVTGSRIEILYEIKGKGTEVLSHRKKNELLDVVGPLGNGFNYELRTTNNKQLILVAGGMGVAPLTFLAEKLVNSSQRTVDRRIIVLIGSKTRKMIMCNEYFKKLGCDVKVATEDGSLGKKGLVTDLLKKILSTVDCQQLTLFACGPKPMLTAVSKIAKRHKIPAQVSLEEFMGCGIGACLGCTIKTIDGYKRVCHDGPVFDANEIIWEANEATTYGTK